MRDDERANLLYSALDGGKPLPDGIDDAELVALRDLGAELRTHAAAMALIEDAEARFDPAFSRHLRATLVAAHPWASRPAPAAEQAAPARVVAIVARGSRQLWRRLIVGATLVIALAAAAFIAFSQSAQPAMRLGLSQATVTESRPRNRALQHSANTATSGQNSVRGTAPRHAGTNPAPTPAADAHVMQTYGGDQSVRSSGTPPAKHFATTAAPRSAVSRPAALQFRLPVSLATFPDHARVYSLRYDALSSAAYKRIVASFPAMHAVAGDQYRSPNGDALTVVRGMGEVRFVGGQASAGALNVRAVPAAKARQLAQAWLAQHGLLPATPLETNISVSGPLITVRFVPSLEYSLVDGQSAINLSVTLAGDNRIMRAEILWPMLQARGTAKLLTPAVAVHKQLSSSTQATAPADTAGVPKAHAAPAVVQVDAVSLVYALAGSGRLATLVPYYRLVGHVAASTGASRDSAYLISAT